MTEPRRPAPTTLPHSPPFSMPSPFPAPRRPLERAPRSRLQRARGGALATVLGLVLGAAVQWLLASSGAPAPVVDAAGRAVRGAVEVAAESAAGDLEPPRE